MRKRIKVYCEHCDKHQEYIVTYGNTIEEIKGVKIEYEGYKCYCKVCGNEVYVGYYDDKNTEVAHKLWKKALNDSEKY